MIQKPYQWTKPNKDVGSTKNLTGLTLFLNPYKTSVFNPEKQKHHVKSRNGEHDRTAHSVFGEAAESPGLFFKRFIDLQ